MLRAFISSKGINVDIWVFDARILLSNKGQDFKTQSTYCFSKIAASRHQFLMLAVWYLTHSCWSNHKCLPQLPRIMHLIQKEHWSWLGNPGLKIKKELRFNIHAFNQINVSDSSSPGRGTAIYKCSTPIGLMFCLQMIINIFFYGTAYNCRWWELIVLS